MALLRRVFGRSNSIIIGMIHLRPLPGSPQATQSLQEVIDIASAEADVYAKNDVDGLMIENMFDRPWQRASQIGPETTAAMTVACSTLKKRFPNMPMGVQVLAGANKEALAVALASGLQYIRAEGFVYSHIGDEGFHNSCAAELTRYRKSIDAKHIQIFADVKKKHCANAITSDVTLVESAKAAELFLADGVIVTGKETGLQTDPEEVTEVQNNVSIPVIVGSGVTKDNLKDYIRANALIVGSSFKWGGHWDAHLDVAKVRSFMQTAIPLREGLEPPTKPQPIKAERFMPIDVQGE